MSIPELVSSPRSSALSLSPHSRAHRFFDLQHNLRPSLAWICSLDFLAFFLPLWAGASPELALSEDTEPIAPPREHLAIHLCFRPVPSSQWFFPRSNFCCFFLFNSRHLLLSIIQSRPTTFIFATVILRWLTFSRSFTWEFLLLPICTLGQAVRVHCPHCKSHDVSRVREPPLWLLWLSG